MRAICVPPYDDASAGALSSVSLLSIDQFIACAAAQGV